MKTREGSQSEIIFTTKQLSDLLDLSKRRIQQLAEENIFVRENRGKYKAFESLRNYITYIQEKKSDQIGEVDYYFEKALHEKIKREKAELELAAMKGQMHQSKDVATVMNDMVASCRAKLLSLPTKLAPKILGKSNVSVIREDIKVEIHEVLTELAEYNRDAFLSRSTDFVEVDEDENSV
jgi:phage terminase Nu1 subunit (DNA packaging protein)